MKKLHFFLIAGLLTATSAKAQLARVASLTAEAPTVGHTATPTAVAISPDSVFIAPDVLPQFTGGADALRSFLAKNLRYPEMAMRQHITGRVFVRFIVDAQGRVKDVSLAKGPGNGLDEEAMRLVWFMPPWQPGRHHGQAVKTACTLPISFEQ